MQKRSIAAVIILSLITIGIYTVYWLISTRKELVNRGANIPGLMLLFAPFIVLAAIAALQLILQLGFAITSPGDLPTRTIPHVLEIFTIGLAVLAVLASIPITVYWTYKYCEGAQHATGGRITSGFAFGMWAVLTICSVGFVWPAIMQDAYNKTN
jgi:hypothetical protein